MYSQSDLRHWITLGDVLDAHEALDLKEASAQRARESRDR